MFEQDEVVRVLTAAVMELLPEGGSVSVPKDLIGMSALDERFCVQIDARDEDSYRIRVVPLTVAMRRKITGRTEADLLAMVPEGWTLKVNHAREAAGADDVVLPKHRLAELGLKPSPRGGWTVVRLITPEGATAFDGASDCAPTDNFCRAEGRTLALDRALRKMAADEEARVADAMHAAAAGAQS